MNAKHHRTLQAIFADPVRAGILWSDIEKLLVADKGAVMSMRRFLTEAGIQP